MKNQNSAALLLLLLAPACAAPGPQDSRSSGAPGAPDATTASRTPPRPAPPLSAKPGLDAETAASRAGSEAPAPESIEAGAVSADVRLTVATVAGEPIDVRDLLARWLHHDSPEVHAYLSHLVAARIAELEAQRLGLEVRPESLARRLAELRGELERNVRASGDPRLSVEDWLRTARGLDPARYFELMEHDARSQMLAERVVRTWLYERGSARVRVILVDDEAALSEARAELDQGVPFADVARARSLDATAAEGGLIAALVDNEFSPLSRLAFQTEPGEVGGPLEESGRFLLLTVEQRQAPLAGTWAEVGPTIEASLLERPLDEAEYRQWEVAVGTEYAPDLTPFFELAGEPVP